MDEEGGYGQCGGDTGGHRGGGPAPGERWEGPRERRAGRAGGCGAAAVGSRRAAPGRGAVVRAAIGDKAALPGRGVRCGSASGAGGTGARPTCGV